LTAKTGYGLGRVMARLKETSETVIALAFLCMNLNRQAQGAFASFVPLASICYFCFYPVVEKGLIRSLVVCRWIPPTAVLVRQAV